MNPLADLSKSWEKRIHKLRLRKYREQFGQYVAEGDRLIEQLVVSGLTPIGCWALAPDSLNVPAAQIEPEQLRRVSGMETVGNSLAVFPKPVFSADAVALGAVECYFDRVRDPGNLGTLLRTAAWFGLRQIWCSPGSVDAFNPKVVQSSMGAVAEVAVHYRDFDEVYPLWISQGRSVFKTEAGGSHASVLLDDPHVALVFGTEGQGLASDIADQIEAAVGIPRAPESQMESLNLAMSAGILLGYRALNYPSIQ
ncbi:hypothetical protein GC167_01745 [bacterium]|nr:hypothetical protein [bacterium]